MLYTQYLILSTAAQVSADGERSQSCRASEITRALSLITLSDCRSRMLDAILFKI